MDAHWIHIADQNHALLLQLLPVHHVKVYLIVKTLAAVQQKSVKKILAQTIHLQNAIRVRRWYQSQESVDALILNVKEELVQQYKPQPVIADVNTLSFLQVPVIVHKMVSVSKTHAPHLQPQFALPVKGG